MTPVRLSRAGAFAALTLVAAGQSPPSEDRVEWRAFADHLPGTTEGGAADLVDPSDGMQAALWEIIRDQLAPLGLELDAAGATGGRSDRVPPDAVAEEAGDPAPPELATVPEPSAALLGTLGLLLLLRRRA